MGCMRPLLVGWVGWGGWVNNGGSVSAVVGWLRVVDIEKMSGHIMEEVEE